MTVGGISIILILGIINFILILFQISTGRRRIRVPLRVHRTRGITLFFSGAIHALLAILTA
jgi:hypothetical protein